MQFPFHCQERIGDPPVAFVSYQDQAGRRHQVTTRGEHTLAFSASPISLLARGRWRRSAR